MDTEEEKLLGSETVQYRQEHLFNVGEQVNEGISVQGRGQRA